MKKNVFFIALSILFLTAYQVKAQLPTVATDVSPLLVLEKVPTATLVNTKGKTVSLDSIIQNKPTVIVFYRGAWCGNCTRNFKEEFTPNIAEIERMGYNLVAICPDMPDSLLVTSKKSGLDAKYFFSDGTGAFTKAMGLAFKQQENARDRLIKYSGGKNTDLYLSVPAVYVVNKSNVILYAEVIPNGISANNRMKWWLLEPVLKALKLYNL